MILKALFFSSILIYNSVNSLTDHQSWCKSEAGSYTNTSIFSLNLDLVLSTLSIQSSTSSFYNVSAGVDPDAVYGLFSCRGDISPGDCDGCIGAAFQSIGKSCPLQKEAMVWYQECILRYANRPIFSTVEEEPHAWWCSPNQISMDVKDFDGVVKNNFNRLIEQVVYRNISSSYSSRFFGANVIDLGGPSGGKLHLQVQCTPDISPSDCDWCLQAAVATYPASCGLGRAWTMIYLPSCQIQYQVTPSPPFESPSLPHHHKNLDVVKVLVPTAVGFLLVFFGVCFCMSKRNKWPKLISLSKFVVKERRKEEEGESDLEITDCLSIDLHAIDTATQGFSSSKKLGEGGFGIVYEGVLENGEHVAVKRLSQNSGQGTKEFKTEVAVVAKLQHKNLVRLVGFCVKGEERLLVYEFMPNLSLDRFLFDSTRSFYLTWAVRYKIIRGIARGLQYLHEDSRVTIVHRDLKSSNILLDEDLEPKIADFGMARLVKLDQTSENTTRVVGTYGYMAPEYLLVGRISVKSDIFSFGVMVLEILSGKSNTRFYQTCQGEGLIRQAKRVCVQGSIEELMDPVLGSNFSRMEAQKCLQIGLLCVKEDEMDRPSMNAVLLMLGTNSVELPSTTILFNSTN